MRRTIVAVRAALDSVAGGAPIPRPLLVGACVAEAAIETLMVGQSLGVVDGDDYRTRGAAEGELR